MYIYIYIYDLTKYIDIRKYKNRYIKILTCAGTSAGTCTGTYSVTCVSYLIWYDDLI